MITLNAAERRQLASAIGMDEQHLYQCLKGLRQIRDKHCVALERESKGRLAVEDLRTDLVWLRIPDPSWPHPSGRPCIDVAAPAAVEQGG